MLKIQNDTLQVYITTLDGGKLVKSGRRGSRRDEELQIASCSDLVERSQESRLLAGEAVASLDGGDGALHVARHQQLRQLQETVAEHEELQRRRRSGNQVERGVTLTKVKIIQTHKFKVQIRNNKVES